MSSNLNDRITRSEAERLHKLIRPILALCGRSELAGSYRRGHLELGDLDFLVVNGDLNLIRISLGSTGLVKEIVRAGDLLTTVIISFNRKLIQVEFTSVTVDSFGAALLHATGSARFNAELRTLAKQKALLLNQYGLTDLASGKIIASKTEQEIFNKLGLFSIPPTERNRGLWEIIDDYKIESTS